MMVLKRSSGKFFFALSAIALLLPACNAPKVKTTSPISSNRGVETLEVIPGELPRWRKTGNLSVNPEGESREHRFDSAIRIQTDKTKKTIQADGKEVIIIADNTDLKIRGGCARLKIEGSGNKISCDFARKIEVHGDKNAFQLDGVVDGTVKGAGNTVAWRNPTENRIPDIEFTGINNVLEQMD